MTKTLIISACSIALASMTATADIIPLAPIAPYAGAVGDDIPQDGTGIGGNSSKASENQFYRLITYFAYPDHCVPIFEGHVKPDNQTVDWSGGGLAGFDYAVLRYEPGEGSDALGGIAAYYLNGMDAAVFPSVGNGPYGNGDFDIIDLFKCSHDVPDGGTTMALLGMGILALGTLKRKMGKA